MLMPDPENERRTLSLEDFIRSTSDLKKRKIYRIILSPLPVLIERIKKTWLAPDGMPNILIVKNAKMEETELRDIINTVCLAEGLLERSLDAQNLAIKTLGPSKTPHPLGHLSIAKAFIMWSCAHEVFHYLRRHALVEKQFGNTLATKHALEYDADLCAFASIYRYLQYFSPKKSEIDLKKTTLKIIYCSIRATITKENVENFYGTNTHPHTAARIFDIAGKLAMLKNFGKPDPNLEEATTRHHLNILINITIQLESMYSKSSNEKNSSKLSSVFSFGLSNTKSRYTSPRNKTWDEIQKVIDCIALLPRNMVDNEQSIAFL